jgi:AcrR family transcriptional regulator
VFIEHGYRHARMEDVAEALGVAKGTLYLYVESKDALFDLVCRSADSELAVGGLPHATPAKGATVAYLVRRIADGQRLDQLARALRGDRRAPAIEIAAIVGEIYDTLARYRVGIKLVDRAARDIPELGRVWFAGSRGGLIDQLARYIARGVAARELRQTLDPAIAARFVVETCGFWALHRHWDVARQEVDESLVRPSVINLVRAALLLEPA